MMLVDPYRFEATGPATIAYDAAYVPTIAGTTATQTGVNFGAVASKRLVIVAVHWNATVSGSAISSATIGGIAATVIIAGTSLGAATPFKSVAIIAAYVPTGTSGTVVVNFGGSSVVAYFFVYLASNIRSITPFGTGSAVANGSPVSTTCNLQADGAVLSAATVYPVSAPLTFTGVTKNYDTSIGTSQGQYGGGCAITPAAVTGASFQQSDPGASGGGPTHTLIVASFR